MTRKKRKTPETDIVLYEGLTPMVKKERDALQIYEEHPICKFPQFFSKEDFERLTYNEKICILHFMETLPLPDCKWCDYAGINRMSIYLFKRKYPELAHKLLEISNAYLDYEIIDARKRMKMAILEGKDTRQNYKHMELLLKHKNQLGTEQRNLNVYMDRPKIRIFSSETEEKKKLEDPNIIDITPKAED